LVAILLSLLIIIRAFFLDLLAQKACKLAQQLSLIIIQAPIAQTFSAYSLSERYYRTDLDGRIKPTLGWAGKSGIFAARNY
jgi:hypothetical protein